MQILIGGPSGVAKSSQAMDICITIGIVHKIGSGFIREITRHFLPKNIEPSLHEYSFGNSENFSNPYLMLKDQSMPLVEPTVRCLERAEREGTSIVIEGVNILPSLYKDYPTDNKFVLYVEDEAKHWQMINGSSHQNRIITEQQFAKVRQIQNLFKKDAIKHNWKLVESTTTKLSDILQS
jgi:2-phosphoglycerate kinase